MCVLFAEETLKSLKKLDKQLMMEELRLQFVTSNISWLLHTVETLLTRDQNDVVGCRLLVVVGEHGGEAPADLREVRGHRPVLKQNVHENISKAERLGTKLLS